MTACGGFFGKAVQKPWPFLRNLGRTSLESSESVSDALSCLPLPAAVRKYSHGRAERGKERLGNESSSAFCAFVRKGGDSHSKGCAATAQALCRRRLQLQFTRPPICEKKAEKYRRFAARGTIPTFGPLCFSFLLNRIPRRRDNRCGCGL